MLHPIHFGIILNPAHTSKNNSKTNKFNDVFL